jgi:hypothetical protein
MCLPWLFKNIFDKMSWLISSFHSWKTNLLFLVLCAIVKVYRFLVSLLEFCSFGIFLSHSFYLHEWDNHWAHTWQLYTNVFIEYLVEGIARTFCLKTICWIQYSWCQERSFGSKSVSQSSRTHELNYWWRKLRTCNQFRCSGLNEAWALPSSSSETRLILSPSYGVGSRCEKGEEERYKATRRRSSEERDK